ncbi:hypothetical protein [Pedobacter xixiisoli]|nr:hypothetical protein [Pedobacter xixiisoli]
MRVSYILMLMMLNIGMASCQQNSEPDCTGKKGEKRAIKSEKIIYYVNGNERRGSFGSDEMNQYDEQGNILTHSMVLYDEDTKKDTIVPASIFHYKDGLLAKQENFSVLRGGIKKYEVETLYDKDKKIIKVTHNVFDQNKAVLDKNSHYYEYTVNSNNIKKSNISYYNDANKKFEFDYRLEQKFDGKNLLEEKYFGKDNEIYREIKNTYNDKKQLIKTINNDQVYAEVYYTYNEHNDVIKRKHTDREDFVSEITFTYKYDCYGNWIEKTEEEVTKSNSKNEAEPKYVVKRAIVYY